jgi:sorbitol/mannitol transport system substrate-binding protein
MKFPITSAVLAAALAISLVGCSTTSGGSSAKPDKLTIMVTTSPSTDALKVSAKSYAKKTGIAIDFVEVPYEQLSTKLVLAGKSKTSTFDMAMLDQLYIPTVAPSAGLLPLDKYIAKDSSYDYADFPQSLKDYTKYKGVSYAVPLSTEPYVQFYRTDLYSSAGIAAATTWPQVTSNVKAVTALGGKNYGYDGWYGSQGAGAEPFIERLYQYGGRILNPKTNQPELDNAVAKRAMQDFAGLASDSPEATISGSSIDAATQFSQINVGLNIAPAGWYSTLDTANAKGKVAVAAVPSQKIGAYEPKNVLKGWTVGISRGSKYPDASWAFLSYALGKSNVQTFIDAGSPVVGRTSTLDSAKYQKEVSYLSEIKSGVVNGLALPANTQLIPILVEMGNDVNAVATGADVDSTMTKMNAAVKKILLDAGIVKP